MSNRVSRVAVALVALGLSGLLTACSAQKNEPPSSASVTAGAASIDLSTPEKTLASFDSAEDLGDWEGAVRCVVGGVSGSKYIDTLKAYANIERDAIKITDVQVKPTADANVVTVTYTPIFIMVHGTDGIAMGDETLTMRKSAAGWQIDPTEPVKGARRRRRRGAAGSQAPSQPAGPPPSLEAMLAVPTHHVNDMSYSLANPDKKMAEIAQFDQRQEEARRAEGLPSLEEESKEAHRKLIELSGIAIGSDARLFNETYRSPIAVAGERADLDAYFTYENLQALRKKHPEPFVKSDDGFTDADYDAALVKAKTDSERFRASGQVLLLPYNTRVRPVENVETEIEIFSRDNELEKTRKPSKGGFYGVWRVEVMDRSAQGKTVWVYGVRTMSWGRGDAVTIALPNQPGAPVPAATDEAASAVLSPTGRAAGDVKARARFDRLVKERRIISLPSGLRCVAGYRVKEGSKTGSVFVTPLAGPYKGKQLVVRTEHVTLANN